MAAPTYIFKCDFCGVQTAHTSKTSRYCQPCRAADMRGEPSRYGAKDPIRRKLGRLLSAARCRKETRGHDCTLELDDLVGLWYEQDGRCAIMGREMDWRNGARDSVSIDRIDSSKGYHADNVQLVLRWVNRAKSDLSQEELEEFARCILGL